MRFALFLRGMILALGAFAITTYVITQSVWTTLIDTVLCAVIIQVGYFAGVLLMAWRQPANGRDEAGSAASDKNQASDAEKTRGTKPGRVPGTSRSGPF